MSSSTLSIALTSRFKPLSRPLLHTSLALAGSWLIALSAQLEVLLPFSPVPITGQTLGVLLVGATLGSRLGAASVLGYLLQGAIGLPFFSGGAAGAAHLLGPSGGYLVGFIPCAWATGWVAERGWDRSVWKSFWGFLAAQTVIFILGSAWLAQFVGVQHVLALGVLPFIPGEIIKTGLAAGLFPAAWKWVKKISEDRLDADRSN